MRSRIRKRVGGGGKRWFKALVAAAAASVQAAWVLVLKREGWESMSVLVGSGSIGRSWSAVWIWLMVEETLRMMDRWTLMREGQKEEC